MVLVMSVWNDYASHMLWLDSTYPANETGLDEGRGTCGIDSGMPATVETNDASSSVVYRKIKFGPAGSTFASCSVCKNLAPASAPAPWQRYIRLLKPPPLQAVFRHQPPQVL